MRHKQSTKRQREAVKYTEAWLQIKFNGNINNFYECSAFLETYLDEAKMREVVDYLIYVADSKANPDAFEKLKTYCNAIIIKRHGEYDFGSYAISCPFLTFVPKFLAGFSLIDV